MILHFDGDLLVYRCGFAAEKALWYITGEDVMGLGVFGPYTSKKEAVQFAEKTWGEDWNSRVVFNSERVLEPVENALHNTKSIIETAREDVGPDEIRVYLSGPTNFREGIAVSKPYKGNRDPDHKPQHGPAIKEYLVDRYGAVFTEGEEADDMVAYSHYAMYMRGELSVLASTDKDLDMIPGLHYNFIKKESYYVEDDEAYYNFWMQMLTGDATDNIPGLPGIGKIKASRMLDGVHVDDMARVVAEKYASFGPSNWQDYLVEQGRLLWMRRYPNEMWSPELMGLDIQEYAEEINHDDRPTPLLY